MNRPDLIAALEIARLGLLMCKDEIAEEMNISDQEITRLQDLIGSELDPIYSIRKLSAYGRGINEENKNA